MATPQEQFPLEQSLSVLMGDSDASRSPAPSPNRHPTKRHRLLHAEDSDMVAGGMSDLSASQDGISQSRSQGDPSSCREDATTGVIE
jgi:hypothetical protein